MMNMFIDWLFKAFLVQTNASIDGVVSIVRFIIFNYVPTKNDTTCAYI